MPDLPAGHRPRQSPGLAEGGRKRPGVAQDRKAWRAGSQHPARTRKLSARPEQQPPAEPCKDCEKPHQPQRGSNGRSRTLCRGIVDLE
jgi:hypothetical protein